MEVLRMNKPKFDKKKCLTCTYHGDGVGYCVRIPAKGGTFTHKTVNCNYAGVTGETCLKPAPNNTIIDLRGDDYDNCKLYKEGKQITVELREMVLGKKRKGE